jgi:hypothetical protein
MAIYLCMLRCKRVVEETIIDGIRNGYEINLSFPPRTRIVGKLDRPPWNWQCFTATLRGKASKSAGLGGTFPASLQISDREWKLGIGLDLKTISSF